MNNIWRVGVFFMLAHVAMPGLSFPCYMTLFKDNCWLNYHVSVDVIDVASNKTVLTLVAPEGQAWFRGQFDCQPRDSFSLVARFSPAFWSGDADKTYRSSRNWSMPEAVTGDTIAWNINICYPGDFSSVPLPPTASSGCHCDYSVAPKITP